MHCSGLRIWLRGGTGSCQATRNRKYRGGAGSFFRLSPLRRQSLLKKLWRVAYPIGIHFVISQLVAVLAVNLVLSFSGKGMDLYYQIALMLTGVADLIVLIPAWYLYRRDRKGRKRCGVIGRTENALFAGEIILLVLLGMALALYGNYVVGMLDFVIDPSDYFEQMQKLEEGYSLPSLLFWMGVCAPVAEESIFRWLVFLRLRDYCRHAWVAAAISAALFGAYHGNMIQAIYAFLLGFFFAMVLEWTGNKWSSVLLHIGANCGSILLSEVIAKQTEKILTATLLYLLAAMLAILVFGIHYFSKMSKDHPARLE